MRHFIIFILTLIPLSTSASFCDTSFKNTQLPFDKNVPPMITNSPFSIVTSVQTAHQSETLTIRIKSLLSELNIGGFIIHALSTTSVDNVLGKFTWSSVGLKLSDCSGENNTATYYAYPGAQGDVELQWQAPNDYVGEILFNAIVAQDYNTYWAGVTSNPVRIIRSAPLTLASYFRSSGTVLDVKEDVDERPLSRAEQYIHDAFYDGCGTLKTCFGVQYRCVEQRSCTAAGTVTFVDGRYIFEIMTNNAEAAYVAIALSRNTTMGDDSVMECVRQGGSARAFTSWNLGRSNTREAVPQNIITVRNESLVDGTMYCKVERSAKTIIRDIGFNLTGENFHYMVAHGPTVSDANIGFHSLGRNVTTEPLKIIRQDDSDPIPPPPPPREPIYEGCGSDTKYCFGKPDGCVEDRSCQAVVTVIVEDDERYEFELQTANTSAAYVSFALSTDQYMGEDSVIECLATDPVRAYSSWNLERNLFENTRENVSQAIFRLLDSSRVNGKTYCKFERDPSTTIQGHEFDLDNEEFYFMLAIGTEVRGDSIALHNLGRWSTDRPFTLPGRGSASFTVRVSALSIAIWLLATICTHILRDN